MSLTKEEKKRLKEFEKAFGYSFKKKEFLKQALMHKSYANEMKLPELMDNERLEFLGDAVLELAVSHLLMAQFQSHPEGHLSKLRAAIVNEKQLAALAEEIGLGEFLFLGKGEERSHGRKKPSLLANAYEALLGAIYMDRGFKKVFDVAKKKFSPIVKQVGQEGFVEDYKTRLQEEVQARFRVTPTYKVVNAEGPDHRKIFEVNLYVQEKLFGIGKGASKKSAEQEAARQALQEILKESEHGV